MTNQDALNWVAKALQHPTEPNPMKLVRVRDGKFEASNCQIIYSAVIPNPEAYATRQAVDPTNPARPLDEIEEWPTPESLRPPKDQYRKLEDEWMPRCEETTEHFSTGLVLTKKYFQPLKDEGFLIFATSDPLNPVVFHHPATKRVATLMPYDPTAAEESE